MSTQRVVETVETGALAIMGSVTITQRLIKYSTTLSAISETSTTSMSTLSTTTSTTPTVIHVANFKCAMKLNIEFL
jgi:hypothetical protein